MIGFTELDQIFGLAVGGLLALLSIWHALRRLRPVRSANIPVISLHERRPGSPAIVLSLEDGLVDEPAEVSVSSW